jgi:hypothetical protein
MSTKKLYSLTPIQSPSDWELDTILIQYFNCESTLSRKYWPRRLRDFVQSIFNLLSAREDLHNGLSQATQNIVNGDILRDMSARLASSTGNVIHSGERKFIGRILRSIRLHRRDMKLSIKQPSAPTASLAEACGWPSDIDDVSDIFQSLSKRSLRCDIPAFFFNVMKSITNVEWKLNFIGSSIEYLSTQTQKPCVIEVEESQVSNVEQHLQVISSELAGSCQCLLPTDLTTVKALKVQGSTSLSEEVFFSSGGISKEGTLGCILMFGNKTYGLTCDHVFTSKSWLGASKTWSEFDDICEKEGRSIYNRRDEMMDCSFFEINSELSTDAEELVCDAIGSEETTEVDDTIKQSGDLVATAQPKISVYNLLPLKFLTADAACIQLGEDVFKMGKQTGLTIGKLRSMSVFFQDMNTGERYDAAVEVEWVGVVSRFASHGDCGSLYCVRRDSMFVPIAIHRASSNDETSYGSNFWEALDVLPEPEEDSALCFVNPPNFAL